MSPHARPLAQWLAARSDEQLEQLLTARRVAPHVDWHDFFDAAEALLSAPLIARVLPTLARADAAALKGAGDDAARARLQALGLLRPDGGRYPEVAAAVAALPTPEHVAETAAPPASASDAAHAAERALTHVSATAELLLLAQRTPLATLTGGMLAAAEKKRLSEEGTVPAGTDSDDLVRVASDAGLLAPHDRALYLTARGQEWLRSPAGARWAALAEGLRAHLPAALRTPSGGVRPPSSWAGALPWDPDWPSSHAALRRRATLLGLLADGESEPEWAVSLRRGEAADPTALLALLPGEVDKIFLQNDLTAIAPGPLVPALDVRLRTMALRESASQASSYRFTADSVADAIAAGETEQSLREFLGELSLTGIPQALGYLITQAAARHGVVQVRADAATGRTQIRSADAHLLETMVIDQALRPLGLVQEAGTDLVTTRVGAGATYWALRDARYPATLTDGEGRPLRAGRYPVPTAEVAATGRYVPLIARLRAHEGPDADAAWRERALEAAVQARTLLLVEVAMPDGSTRELTLEATGLGGGRLRGRDRAGGVEHTLPVASIRSARPISAG